MQSAIEICRISKSYSLQKKQGYQSLRENLMTMMRRKGYHKESDPLPAAADTFEALSEVSLQLKPGEICGIAGRNGAGKSTLLKVLAGITPPTKGHAIMRGRVSALLEVGTGFHPELTGRENIFFNGAILGMRASEIRRTMDEIIDFSGVEPMIDQPLKHFSSGMQMRLAFSVAAHLRSDILLLDEVLAVGDAGFQKKCLGKMEELGRKEGKTAILVSHDLTQLGQLCTRGVLLNQGQMAYEGSMEACIREYKDLLYSDTEIDKVARGGNGAVRITGVEVSSPEGGSPVAVWNDLIIRVFYEKHIKTPVHQCRIDLGFNNESGKRVAWVSSIAAGESFNLDKGELVFKISQCPLRPGHYDLNIFTEVNHQLADWLRNVYPFSIDHRDYFNPMERTPAGQGDFFLSYSVEQL